MSYKVELARSAVRELRKIPEPFHQKIIDAFRDLEDNPRLAGCKKLSNSHSLYRVRVGNYRIVYEISDRIKLIIVERIADRKDIYRKR